MFQPPKMAKLCVTQPPNPRRPRGGGFNPQWIEAFYKKKGELFCKNMNMNFQSQTGLTNQPIFTFIFLQGMF